MSLEGSILKMVREFIVGTEDNKEFDNELIPHINSSLSKLNQNGVGRFIVVSGEDSMWDDFKNPEQVKGNEYFQLVPMYVVLNTQLLFDPPPPSNVEYHSNNSKELLWRLKIAYEEDEIRQNGNKRERNNYG